MSFCDLKRQTPIKFGRSMASNIYCFDFLKEEIKSDRGIASSSQTTLQALYHLTNRRSYRII